MITPEEFTQKMSRIESNGGDPEDRKSKADAAVASLLKDLGYTGAASIWERLGGWN